MALRLRRSSAIFLFISVQSSAAAAPPSAAALLDRFRAVDWGVREVGRDKDLSDRAWRLRMEVENGLVLLGRAASPTLIEACGDTNRYVRHLASNVLGSLDDTSAVAALAEVVRNDTYAPARLAAVEALGRLGAVGAADIVRAAAEDESPHVRLAARWALPRLERGEGVADTLRRTVLTSFDAEQIATAAIGEPAPDFALVDDAGKTVRLSDFRAQKHVVLVFLLSDW